MDDVRRWNDEYSAGVVHGRPGRPPQWNDPTQDEQSPAKLAARDRWKNQRKERGDAADAGAVSGRRHRRPERRSQKHRLHVHSPVSRSQVLQARHYCLIIPFHSIPFDSIRFDSHRKSMFNYWLIHDLTHSIFIHLKSMLNYW